MRDKYAELDRILDEQKRNSEPGYATEMPELAKIVPRTFHFTELSAEKLDIAEIHFRFFNGLRKDDSKRAKTEAYAAYFGCLIVKDFGARWINGDQYPMIQLCDGNLLDVRECAYQAIYGDSSRPLYDIYRMLYGYHYDDMTCYFPKNTFYKEKAAIEAA